MKDMHRSENIKTNLKKKYYRKVYNALKLIKSYIIKFLFANLSSWIRDKLGNLS